MEAVVTGMAALNVDCEIVSAVDHITCEANVTSSMDCEIGVKLGPVIVKLMPNDI